MDTVLSTLITLATLIAGVIVYFFFKKIKK